MSDFRCDVRRLQDKPVAVVTLAGDIDSIAVHRLNEVLGEMIETGITHVVVDMVRVGYLNSEGWRILLVRTRELEAKKGELRLADMAPDLDGVFKMLGIAEVITKHDDLEEALTACLATLSAS